ncbi:hypothetical protein AAC387_Pa03g3792 [Persea americana]
MHKMAVIFSSPTKKEKRAQQPPFYLQPIFILQYYLSRSFNPTLFISELIILGLPNPSYITQPSKTF